MYVKIAREATKRIDREQLPNRRKKDENGNLPCQCENLQQEAKEQFVILW